MDRGVIWRVGVPLVVGAWALWQLSISPVGSRGPVRLIGLALAVIGLAGVIAARYTLGRSFSIAPKAWALVTTGIYSRIRNPIYVSGEIFLIGVAIMLWNPILTVIVVAVIPLQLWRARREAKVLEEKFGEEYRDYRRQTWF
ncbi:MAG: isoprenylcysteine carboxylmethyltransferase family protein [Terriglobales bacterium]|jgi:protein-S-isoprenylcysteine O-methyltransferase Ste14